MLLMAKVLGFRFLLVAVIIIVKDVLINVLGTLIMATNLLMNKLIQF